MPKFKIYDKTCSRWISRVGADMWTLLSVLDAHRDHRTIKCKLKFYQFTGLLDCNGKEIYAGDIVNYHLDHEYTMPVIFRTGENPHDTPGFIIDTGNNYGHIISKNSIGVSDLKVVGNIYENPDLLPTPPLTE